MKSQTTFQNSLMSLRHNKTFRFWLRTGLDSQRRCCLHSGMAFLHIHIYSFYWCYWVKPFTSTTRAYALQSHAVWLLYNAHLCIRVCVCIRVYSDLSGLCSICIIDLYINFIFDILIYCRESEMSLTFNIEYRISVYYRAWNLNIAWKLLKGSV